MIKMKRKDKSFLYHDKIIVITSNGNRVIESGALLSNKRILSTRR